MNFILKTLSICVFLISSCFSSSPSQFHYTEDEEGTKFVQLDEENRQLLELVFVPTEAISSIPMSKVVITLMSSPFIEPETFLRAYDLLVQLHRDQQDEKPTHYSYNVSISDDIKEVVRLSVEELLMKTIFQGTVYSANPLTLNPYQYLLPVFEKAKSLLEFLGNVRKFKTLGEAKTIGNIKLHDGSSIGGIQIDSLIPAYTLFSNIMKGNKENDWLLIFDAFEITRGNPLIIVMPEVSCLMHSVFLGSGASICLNYSTCVPFVMRSS